MRYQSPEKIEFRDVVFKYGLRRPTLKGVSFAVEKGELEVLSLGTPSSINIYVNSFEAKEAIKSFIEKYNNHAKQNKKHVSVKTNVDM